MQKKRKSGLGAIADYPAYIVSPWHRSLKNESIEVILMQISGLGILQFSRGRICMVERPITRRARLIS